MKRGLTMIELLFALVLLGAIVSVSTAWTQLSAQWATTAVDRSRTLATAELVLELIADDCTSGDFVSRREKENPFHRVACANGALTVASQRSSDGSEILHQYRFEVPDHSVNLIERSASGDSSTRGKAHLLTRDVLGFEVTLDEKQNTLTVAITLMDGTELTRRIRVP